LSTAEIRDILDQALPLGLETVKITGGEPFVRDDIVEIVSYAHGLGLSVLIESNAMLLTEEVVQALARSGGLGRVAVSLDGATPDSHAMLRGSRVSFEAAIQGIERLVRHGAQVQIISCLHRGNAQEMEDLIALATRLGASSIKFNPIMQLGRGQEMAERDELLSLQEVLALSYGLGNGRGTRGGVTVHMSLPVAFLSLNAIRRQGFRSCGVMNLLGVLPHGELSLCGVGEAQPELVFGQVGETPIKEVWEGSPTLARLRREIAGWPTGLCRRCMMRSYCIWGYCRADAYVLSGSLAAPASICQASFEAGLFPASRLLPEGR
jgi:SynChlorMet cassette radical SAM/SPASM protein ScmF